MVDRSFIKSVLLGPLGHIHHRPVPRSLMLQPVERLVELFEPVVLVDTEYAVVRGKGEHLG